MAVVPRIRGPVPSAIVVKLRTTVSGVQAFSAGVNGYYNTRAVRLNDIWDPLITGAPAAGDQPRYYTQWAAMYRRYMVRKASMKMVRHNTASTNDDGGYLWMEVRSGNEADLFNPSLYTVEHMLERATIPGRRARYKRITSVMGGSSRWESDKIQCVPNFEAKTAGSDAHDNDAAFGSSPGIAVLGKATIHCHQAGGAPSFWVDYVIEQEVILYQPTEVMN